MITTVFLCIALLGGILGMIETGRRIGVRKFRKEGEAAAKGFGALVGAVFALLGLILAFTFSGALTRFDGRRQLVVKEANDIGTAWRRLDLLHPDAQVSLRDRFRQYLDVRIEAYGDVSDREALQGRLARSSALQKEIWELATEASVASGAMAAQVLLLPALNAMFDTATSQEEAARVHPPKVIFCLLAALILACSLFAGYDMGGSQRRNLLHSTAFAIVLAVTVYVIVDLEYPRLGFIRVSDSDAVLVQLRANMN